MRYLSVSAATVVVTCSTRIVVASDPRNARTNNSDLAAHIDYGAVELRTDYDYEYFDDYSYHLTSLPHLQPDSPDCVYGRTCQCSTNEECIKRNKAGNTATASCYCNPWEQSLGSESLLSYGQPAGDSYSSYPCKIPGRLTEFTSTDGISKNSQSHSSCECHDWKYKLISSDDGITIKQYGKSYDTVEITSNGFLALTNSRDVDFIPTNDFPTDDNTQNVIIGPWMADLSTCDQYGWSDSEKNPENQGSPFFRYRLGNDPEIDQLINDRLKPATAYKSVFNIVVTWYRMGSSSLKLNGKKFSQTVQLILTSDGIADETGRVFDIDYMMFSYQDIEGEDMHLEAALHRALVITLDQHLGPSPETLKRYAMAAQTIPRIVVIANGEYKFLLDPANIGADMIESGGYSYPTDVQSWLTGTGNKVANSMGETTFSKFMKEKLAGKIHGSWDIKQLERITNVAQPGQFIFTGDVNCGRVGVVDVLDGDQCIIYEPHAQTKRQDSCQQPPCSENAPHGPCSSYDPCNGHGTCRDTSCVCNTGPTCDCFEGYSGQYCENENMCYNDERNYHAWTDAAGGSGDVHYKTFDGPWIENNGYCQYTLSTNANCPNENMQALDDTQTIVWDYDPSLPEYSVIVDHEPHYEDSEYAWGVSFLNGVSVHYRPKYNNQLYSFVMKKSLRGTIKFLVEGKNITDLASSTNFKNEQIAIRVHGFQIMIYLGVGIYDRAGKDDWKENVNTKVDNFLIAIRYQPEQSSVAVSISCKMQNKVCGILGNYNKNPYDIENPKRAEGRPWNHPESVDYMYNLERETFWSDLDSRAHSSKCPYTNNNGNQVPVRELADFESISASRVRRQTGFTLLTPPPTDSCTLRDEYRTRCQEITQAPFDTCTDVNTTDIVDNCVYDLCQTSTGTNIVEELLCAMMTDFVSLCNSINDRSQHIISWRTPDRCSLLCGTNQHYVPCAQPECYATQGSCSVNATVCLSSVACVEGCFCNENYLSAAHGLCIAEAISNCNDEVDPSITVPCVSAPCQNGGVCKNEAQMGNEFTGYTCICVPGFFGVNCEDEAYQVDSAADVVELVFENNSRGDDADPVLQHGCFCSRLRSETKYSSPPKPVSVHDTICKGNRVCTHCSQNEIVDELEDCHMIRTYPYNIGWNSTDSTFTCEVESSNRCQVKKCQCDLMTAHTLLEETEALTTVACQVSEDDVSEHGTNGGGGGGGNAEGHNASGGSSGGENFSPVWLCCGSNPDFLLYSPTKNQECSLDADGPQITDNTIF